MSFFLVFLLGLPAFSATLIVKHKSAQAPNAGFQSERLSGPFAQYELIDTADTKSSLALRNHLLARKHLAIESITISRPRFEAMADLPSLYLASPMKDPAFKPVIAKTGEDPGLKDAWGWKKIQTDLAWRSTQGSDDLVVAVIDSGIDYNHEDLQASLFRDGDYFGWDFVNKDALPYDDLKIEWVGHIGHGTHVASIIAAQANNGVGFAGIAPKVKILPLKFLNASNRGEDADAIAAFSVAVEKGAKIINASWGGTGDPDSEENRPMKEAIEILRQQGVLLVAAAGNSQNNNDGGSPVLPATYKIDNIISVAKSDKNDEIPWNSGRGKKSVHLIAPGEEVVGAAPNNTYRKSSGTSFAVPHVVGALALIWSQHPEWSYLEVKNALLKNVDASKAAADATITGGRVNVFKALNPP